MQAVVLAESLVRRLPGCTSVAAAIMQNVIEGSPADEEQGLGTGPGATVSPGGKAADGHSTAALSAASNAGGSLKQQQEKVPGKEAAAAAEGTDSGHAPAAGCNQSAPRAAGSSGCIHPPAVLRAYRPLSLVSRPASRLALAALMCPGAALSLGEGEAGEALGAPHITGQIASDASAGSTRGMRHPSGTVYSGSQQATVAPACAGAGPAPAAGPMPQRAAALMRQLMEQHWAHAVHREWVTSVHVGKDMTVDSSAAGAHTAGLQPSSLCSRMYVQHAEGEMRIATTLVSDPVM